MYRTTMMAGWGDMDFNAHMRNTAYLDKSGDCRMLFFAEHGFPMSEFMRLKLGPVVMQDSIDYLREVRLLDRLEVTLSVAGSAADGSRWLLRNEFFRPDGKLVARVNSAGGWMDLVTRKLAPPPPTLRAAMDALGRSEDFQSLPSSVT